MIKNILGIVVRFFVLIFFQVFVLNNIDVGGYINPFLYILFVITLPFDTPPWLVLVLGFFMSIIVDMFSNTLGMHTTATVFVSYLRSYILNAMSPRDGYDNVVAPSFRTLGFSWFLTYAFIMVFAHHFILFFAEAFRFTSFFYTLVKVVFSTFATIVLILIAMALVRVPKNTDR